MADHIPTKLAPESRNEIATVQKDVTSRPFGGILYPHDDTLATRGNGQNYKIYDDIERDCHAYGVLQKRKLAVIGRPWQVDPASEDALDVKAADMVRAQLSAIGVPSAADPGEQIVVASNFDLVCYNLLDAVLKGFAVGEVMWDVDGGEIVVREVRPRDQRRFNFDIDYKLRLKTWGNFIPGDEIPPRKFLVHSYGAKDGSPFGLGLGSRLFWPSMFKRQGLGFWLTFLDKFGSPTGVGKYPNGASPSDQEKLLDALGAIAQDAGVVVPEGMEISLLEATRGGTAGYENFARYMDEQITMAVLGESPSTRGGGGALAAAANEREEVRLELVQADADLLSATLNGTLSAWLTAYNVPGARPPKIWRQVKKAEDLKARSERDKNIFALGYRPTLAAITETYGGEWEAVAPAARRPAKDAGAPAGATEFSEADATDPTPIDTLTEALSEQGGPAWAKMLDQVRAIVANATSMEGLRDDLLAAYGSLDSAELARVMALGFSVADLVGRLDAHTEADG
jgi:phage gp29-like protein